MGALAEQFFGTHQQVDGGKYKSFRVGYSGDEAAVTFYLRTPRVFSFAENPPYSHSGGGRKVCELHQTSRDSDIFSLDELVATLTEKKKQPTAYNVPDLSAEERLTLGTLWAGFHALDRFIEKNGQRNPECDLVLA